MFEQVEDIERKYEELLQMASEPEAASDGQKYMKLMKEQAELAPVVAAYREYRDNQKSIDEALEIINEESDEEMKALAREELSEAKEKAGELENRLKILLLPKDINDDRNVIVEIRAGAGGDEAALFAAEVYRMYVHYAEGRGWKVETIEYEETGIGGMKNVSFMINGSGAYAIMKYESGVHRVQRVPETESGGRIHTSTITVAVMPEAEEEENR